MSEVFTTVNRIDTPLAPDDIRRLALRRIGKHGDHDQSSHGNWANGSDIFAVPNSLGFARKDMPQIPGVNQDEFIRQLAAEGIRVDEEMVSPFTLNPVQSHLNRTKIARAKSGILGGVEKLLTTKSFVSNDNFILDGHHRWGAYMELGRAMPIRRVDMDIEDLLIRTAQFNVDHGIDSRDIATTVAKIRKHISKGGLSGQFGDKKARQAELTAKLKRSRKYGIPVRGGTGKHGKKKRRAKRFG